VGAGREEVRVKRLLISVLAVLAFPAAAAAHPLGNFTINRYAGIELSGDHVYVHYVLDVAEIPTVQEGARIQSRGFARSMAGGLELRLDGRRVPLRLVDSALETRPGAAGLATLRFEGVYEARARASALRFRDTNFENRRGWREVVVTADAGATIRSSTAPASSRSRMLTAYPRELLSEPLDVDTATVSYRPGSSAGDPPTVGELGTTERVGGGFESLVSHELTVGFVLLSLVLALFWGAAHALEPGHGKAIVAGYLVGARGRPRDAVLLGLIVTVSHTLGVFALGLVTLALSEFIVPDQLYPWLNLVAGLLVVAVGVAVLRSRLHDWLHAQLGGHGHPHDHDHGHKHEHRAGRGLLGVGISGGIIPCPTALVVLLAAISLQRIGYGLVLILAFSVGLAATVTAIGFVAVTARRAFARRGFDGRLVRALPAISAVVVVALGLVMTARALPQLA
jgi:nickel/cobalt transporter (NicO) family protein